MSAAFDLRAASLPLPARSRASEALALARLGFALVPMMPRSKKPYYDLLPKENGRPSWQPLALRPASDAEILAWFAADPECGIAAIMGKPSGGIVAVDVDHGAEVPPSLILTPTVSGDSSEGSDGRWRGHLFYRAAGAVRKQRHPWGEVLGEGCLVVLPPSIHPNGHPYTWTEGLGPGEVDVAPAPDWIYDGRAGARLPDALNARDRERVQQVPSEARTILFSPHRGSPLDFLMRDPEAALAIMRKCGARVARLGQAFCCPIPGHDERRPSMALYQQPDGAILCHDFHARDGVEWLAVPDVFASVVTGKPQRLTPGERAVWHLRAAAEAKIVQPPTVAAAPLPADAPDSVRAYYQGFLRLLALRALYDGTQTAAPFSWRFAAGWCGIGSPNTVQKAAAWLLARGYLVAVRPDGTEDRGSRSVTMFALGRPRD
ncbi:MAG: bifunctional DNA primase/polymerase [Firmicutes bacterium]|nr:bifunctional DNA primase/polymerase [Bacillota bacterium]